MKTSGIRAAAGVLLSVALLGFAAHGTRVPDSLAQSPSGETATPVAGSPTAGAANSSSPVPSPTPAAGSPTAGAASSSSPVPSPTPAAGFAVPAATATPTGATSTPAAAAPSATPTATGSTAAEDDLPPVTSTDEHSGGSPSNRIVAINRTDSRLRVRGKVQVNHIEGDNASPVNSAEAYSSCTGCDTLAVALQIDLISTNASTVAPQNQAVALNYQCTNCNTSARALQYVFQVDDPDQVPDRVRDLVSEMNRELDRVAHDQSITDAGQAESVVDGVISDFQDLAQNLSDQRDDKTDETTPGAQPSP